jgi:hypothetical protein
MRPYTAIRSLNSVLALAGVTVLFGCAATADAPREASTGRERAQSSGSARPEAVGTLVDARPAALVNGRTILWGDLRPLLSELGGATALQEAILDRRLDVLAADAELAITPDDVAAERKRLIESLDEDPNTAARLLETVRSRQGLGEVRFARLMQRNAILRALVRDQVNLTPAAVERMYQLTHGPARQVRLITVPNLPQARNVIERIEAGEPFVEVAVNVSTDTSAARGGLLEPVSREDASYPKALRDAIWSLEEPGALSAPVLMESGYAIVQLVRTIEGADTPLDEVRDDMERLARLRQERLLMDRLARRILDDVSITIFDDSLRWSWRNAQRQRVE